MITFQRKRANRRVVNEPELISLLETYAPVNIVEFNASHSFKEQLWTMSRTGVYISVCLLPMSIEHAAVSAAGLCCQHE